MKYRDAYIEDELVLTDSGTKTIGIPFKDVVSQLYFLLQATNGATINRSNPPIKNLSKVELVDGSDVLFSLSGPEAQGLNYINHGKVPFRLISECGGDYQRDVFYMDFGRYLGDPLWAFDPNKFTNPQIKFTWNLAAINTVGDEGFESGTGRMTILARLFDEPVAPGGFFMSKEHYSFTSAAKGVEPVDMPRDHIYRTLFTRVYLKDSSAKDILSKYKLTEENDKRIPFELHEKELRAIMMMPDEPAKYGVEYHAKTLDTLYHDVYAWYAVRMAASVGAGKYRFHNQGLGMSGYTDFHCGEGDQTDIDTRERWIAEVVGRYFHALSYYRFGDPQNPNDWYNPTALGDLKLKLTQAKVDAAVAVCLQQARKY